MVFLACGRNIEVDDAVVGLRVLREEQAVVDETVLVGAALRVTAGNDELGRDAV